MMSHVIRRFVSSVSWSPKLLNPYGNNSSRKIQIEQLVTNHAKDKDVDARGAETAEIMYEKSIVAAACISILPT